MKAHHITLTPAASKLVKEQISQGRYKDFSAAVQDAVWHQFRVPDIFEEYGVTSEEVKKSAAKDFRQIKADKKAGKLAKGLP